MHNRGRVLQASIDRGPNLWTDALAAPLHREFQGGKGIFARLGLKAMRNDVEVPANDTELPSPPGIQPRGDSAMGGRGAPRWLEWGIPQTSPAFGS